MYERILVPLDGSKLAESAIPHAEELAKLRGTGQVTLISVTEQVRARTRVPEAQELYRNTDGPEVQGAGSETIVTFGKKEKQAERYLSRIAREMGAKGIRADTEVLIGDPAAEIANYAADPGCDIIVMSSHGRSGPSRWAYGSVADKVFRAACVPVLMVRAPGCGPGI